MSTSRQNIVVALITALGTISVANGYRSAVGARVYAWPDPRLDPDHLPALVVHDTTAPVEMEPHPYFSHTLTVEIYAFTAGDTAGSALSDIMADILQAVGVDHTFGGLAIQTRPLDCNKTEIEQREKTIAVAEVILEIDYRTNQWSL